MKKVKFLLQFWLKQQHILFIQPGNNLEAEISLIDPCILVDILSNDKFYPFEL